MALCRLEKGASYVGLEIIGKLADVLEVEPADLLIHAGTRADLKVLNVAVEPAVAGKDLAADTEFAVKRRRLH